MNVAKNSQEDSFLNHLSPVRPIQITTCQEECANIFGFDFDIKFCKMPESIVEKNEKKKETKREEK